MIVPLKLGNGSPADPVEGSEAPDHGTVCGKHDECIEIRSTVSTKQKRIAELAKQSPQMAFTSLAYLMDIDWLVKRTDGLAKTERWAWTE